MDLVIEAFVKSGVDADLYLKVPPQAKDTPENLRLPANVHLERRFLPFHEVFEWYGLADCFIAPSRGEGFGLMPLQAMAMGIPTIITATSGQAEYSHIATTVVPHRSKRSDFVGNWDEADMDSLVQAIRDHYANRDKYELQALANVPKVKEFSWAKAAKKLVGVLPEGKVLDGAAQFKPFACMMRIVTNRNIESSINMVTHKFQKGVEYVVKEGVFEVLSNAGYIDSYKVEPL
jgi:glycosyltransferase involved in cell wall biosynthesis